MFPRRNLCGYIDSKIQGEPINHVTAVDGMRSHSGSITEGPFWKTRVSKEKSQRVSNRKPRLRKR